VSTAPASWLRRREFITLLGGTVAAWPLAARTQQAERMRRIGVLQPFAESEREAQMWMAAFREDLQKLGCADPTLSFPARRFLGSSRASCCLPVFNRWVRGADPPLGWGQAKVRVIYEGVRGRWA
jgi:hypothetical protein